MLIPILSSLGAPFPGNRAGCPPEDRGMLQSATQVGDTQRAELAQLRDQLYEGLPVKGKKAQGALVLWMAGLQPRVSGEDIDRIVTHKRVQFELKLPDLNGGDLAEAVSRAASELGAWNIYDALAQPMEKLLLIMAIPSK